MCLQVKREIQKIPELTKWAYCVYNVGMKKKPAKQNRTSIKNMLRVRLTEAERKLIDDYAADKALGASTWARMELLAIIARAKKEP